MADSTLMEERDWFRASVPAGGCDWNPSRGFLSIIGFSIVEIIAVVSIFDVRRLQLAAMGVVVMTCASVWVLVFRGLRWMLLGHVEIAIDSSGINLHRVLGKTAQSFHFSLTDTDFDFEPNLELSIRSLGVPLTRSFGPIVLRDGTKRVRAGCLVSNQEAKLLLNHFQETVDVPREFRTI